MSGHMNAGMSGDQNNMNTVGDPVDFDTVHDFSGANIALDVTTNVGRITLQPAITYILLCTISFGTSTGAGREFILYDVTNGAEILGSKVLLFNAAAGGTVGGSQFMHVPLTPTLATEYEVRLNTAADTDIRGAATSLTIFEAGDA